MTKITTGLRHFESSSFDRTARGASDNLTRPRGGIGAAFDWMLLRWTYSTSWASARKFICAPRRNSVKNAECLLFGNRGALSAVRSGWHRKPVFRPMRSSGGLSLVLQSDVGRAGGGHNANALQMSGLTPCNGFERLPDCTRLAFEASSVR